MSAGGIYSAWIARTTLTIAAGALSILIATAAVPASSVVPDVEAIIQNSVVATHRNWAVAAQFDHCERDVTSAGAKTYAVIMILGSPYHRLVAAADKALSEDDRQRQQADEDAARVARANETTDERARRVEKYERRTQRNRRLLEQLPSAFDFTSEGMQTSDGFDAYVIRATPKRDYRPTSNEAEVLTGMEGRLWIERHSFQWIKVEATVVHPVSIEALLATVEPGTRLSLAQRPVASDVWLPTHFAMRTRARFLFLLKQRTDVEETYFDYRRVEGEQSGIPRDDLNACLRRAFN
jgi:hypothetical protein